MQVLEGLLRHRTVSLLRQRGRKGTACLTVFVPLHFRSKPASFETTHAHNGYGYDRTYMGAMSPENENPCAKYQNVSKHDAWFYD